MCSTDRHTLLADSIRLAFGTFNVLNGAWLRSETGKITGVLGRNGSGKSCMFKAIMGGLRTQELFVRVDDEILTGWKTCQVHGTDVVSASEDDDEGNLRLLRG